MAALTIRNLDDDLKARLRLEAASNGHSMEEEARLILRRVLTRQRAQPSLARRIHRRFAALGGVELEIPKRTEVPRVLDDIE